MYIRTRLSVGVVGGEPVPSASAQEESGDGKPGENEPAAVPGGQQILPPRLQEHRWLATKLLSEYFSDTNNNNNKPQQHK